MAVQQNKKSPSKRGMHRSHDFLTNPSLAIESTTGEVHLRHHICSNGNQAEEDSEFQECFHCRVDYIFPVIVRSGALKDFVTKQMARRVRVGLLPVMFRYGLEMAITMFRRRQNSPDLHRKQSTKSRKPTT